jgi:Xaa-Pro aminopeptidase
MKRIILFLLLCAPFIEAQPQLPEYPARYDVGLSSSFTKTRRDAVIAKLPPNALAIFFSAPTRVREADVDFEYRQDSNLYYLTGTNEAESTLILAPSGMEIDGKTVKEVLFVPARNPRTEKWNGRFFGAARAQTELGVEIALDNDKFEEVMTKLIDANKYTIFHMRLPDGLSGAETPNPRFMPPLTKQVKFLKKQFTEKSLQPNPTQLAQIMRDLRGVKMAGVEMDLLQKAIDISCAGHVEVMKSAEPDMFEYQLEAVLDFVYGRNGSYFAGYPHIVGSGENSTILHYESNRRKIKNGDMVLIDSGAEYMGYTADVTRTFPANGKFSPEQKAIYELVLKAQDAAIAVATIGTNMNQTSVAAQNVIADGLIALGLMKNRSELQRFLPHGVSHHIGLMVHDTGNGKLEEGMVITVEPGIYIDPAADIDPKWWNIGVRIEDDILITKDGTKLLSGKAPRTVADIEATMRQRGIGNMDNGLIK